ncbi:MAG: 5-(carboxyamino)imidazole ribonucleotide synthase [Gammaproteobacteria bacterium]|nr:5-(carboxyamino)imidazole ribonucleotide synthase [Gammaproteobacteria bacterium]
MKVGMLGGGQLSLMLAEAARPLDIEVVFIDPAADACAATAATQIQADYDDPAALDQLARQVDVVTYEFENVPSEAVRILSEDLDVFPAANALATAQDRLFEKNQLVALDIPVPEFRSIDSLHDLRQAVMQLGMPTVLKTRRFGYDGKGQAVIRSEQDIESAWQSIVEAPAILEAFMPFDREVSIIAVRDRQGNHQTYPLSENIHKNGILDQSYSRAEDPAFEQAEKYISKLMDELEYVGVLALELFQVGDKLYANEFAPRVHNSGHWTIEGTICSQFENHMRAVAGLLLGEVKLTGSSLMLNCIGEMPDVRNIKDLPGVAIHDYGKAAREGRKVGHITLTAESDMALGELVGKVQRELG